MDEKKETTAKKAKVLPTCYGVPVTDLTSKNFTRRKLMDACGQCSNLKAERASLNESRFIHAFSVSGCCAVIACPVNKVPTDKRN